MLRGAGVFKLFSNRFAPFVWQCRADSWLQNEENEREWTHSAKLAWGNDDAPFMQHTGIELEHVVDVHSHKVLCQVPLEIDRNRRICRYITNCPCTSCLQLSVNATDCESPSVCHKKRHTVLAWKGLGLPPLQIPFCKKGKWIRCSHR